MIRELFHKWLNPHCLDCQSEYMRLINCDSCDVLKQELAFANQRIDSLIEALTTKPEPQAEVGPPQFMTQTSKHIPWRVRQQMLEAEDREKARLMKAAKVNSTVDESVQELENEVINATQ